MKTQTILKRLLNSLGAPFAAAVILAMSPLASKGATVYYVGTLTNTSEISNWLTPSVPKTFSITGQNKYGTFCAADYTNNTASATTISPLSTGGANYLQSEYFMVNALWDADQSNTGNNALVNNNPTNYECGIYLKYCSFTVKSNLTGMTLRVGVMVNVLGKSDTASEDHQGVTLLQTIPNTESACRSITVPFTNSWLHPVMIFFDILNAQVGDVYVLGMPSDIGDFTHLVGYTPVMGPVAWDVAPISAAATAPSITTITGASQCRAGDDFLLSVMAGGAPSPAYQWCKNGSPISNATNLNYWLRNTASGDAGSYTVIVSNASGSVTSSPVALTVVSANLAPSITAYRSAVLTEPSLASFYTFDNGLNDLVGTNNSGAFFGGPVACYSMGQGLGGGLDQSVVLSGDGLVNLGYAPQLQFTNFQGTIELWLRPDWTANVGVNASIIGTRDNVSGYGTGYGINMSSAWNAIGLWNNASYKTVAIPTATPHTWHHLGIIFNTNTCTIVWDGVIAGTIPEGLNAGISAKTPVLLGGQSQLNVTFPNFENWVGAFDEVAFFTSALSTSEIAAHFAAATSNSPPVITVQPTGDTMPPGLAYNLGVTAKNGQLGYQWYQNSSPLANANSNSLAFTSLSPDNTGTYYCVVTNAVGVVTSSPAILIVTGTASVVASSYESAVTNEPSLISFYPFDDGTANDYMGINNGVLTNSYAFHDGIGGGPDLALILPANGNGFASLGGSFLNGGPFDFLSGGTVEAWIRADWLTTAQPTYNPCIFAERATGDVNYSIHMDKNKTAIGIYNGATYLEVPLPAVCDTNWHHMTMIISNNAIGWGLYWDGKWAGSRTNALGGLSAPAMIGSSTPAGSEWWIGGLDDVALYSTVFTATQVSNHYAAYGTAGPARIVQQPQGGYFAAGAPVTLSVQTAGLNVGYSWFNGATAVGGNSSSLSITNSGAYFVVVSNAVGMATSTVAQVTIAVPNQTTYLAAVQAEPSLVSLYTFDGQNANDVMGVHNGSFLTSPSFTSGYGGGGSALLLDGTNGAVTFGAVPDFDLLTGGTACDLWLRADWDTNTMAYNPAILGNDSITNAYYEVRMSSNKTSIIVVYGTNSYTTAIPYAGTNWNYLAINFNNPNITLYWNGVNVGSPRPDWAPPFYTTQLGTSSSTGTSNVWVGAFDDLAFYNNLLNASNIVNHYDAIFTPATVAPPAPVNLTITLSGNNVIVTWPSSASNGVLQAASQLPATNWTSVANSSPATLQITNAVQFFRLKEQ